MARLDPQARVLAEWFRLPESRRRDATDAVVFAFRVLRDRPELVSELPGASHELITDWLLPYLQRRAGE